MGLKELLYLAATKTDPAKRGGQYSAKLPVASCRGDYSGQQQNRTGHRRRKT